MSFARFFGTVTLLAALAILAPGQGSAQAGATRVDRTHLCDLMQTEALFDILQREAESYGATLATDVLGQEADPQWRAAVAKIHAPDRLRPAFETIMLEHLAPRHDPQISAFLGSALGQRLISLELSAREALLDPSVEGAAQAALDLADESDAPRLDLVRDVIEAGDLIDANVTGGLNSNFAFYRAMVEGGAYPYDISESDMLAEVMAQEPQIRAEVESWIEAYLFMAYQPLSDADLNAWLAFTRSEAGQALIHAQFVAFDHVFEQSSAALGGALARRIVGRDL